MYSKLNPIWGFVKSKVFALALIFGIIAAIVIDAFLLARRWAPVQGLAAQTGTVYNLWWFQVLVLLLLINLAACVTDGVFRRLKNRQNHPGLWGSTLFHLGLILILIGTLLTGQLRAMSTIMLIQGEGKEIPYRAITSKDEATGGENDRLFFLLQEQEYELNNSGNVKDVQSLIALGQQGSVEVTYSVTEREQFSYRGLYMFPNSFGYAVALEVENSQGDRVVHLVIPMETKEYAEGVKSFSKRSLRFNALSYELSFNLYPDIGITGNQTAINRSPIPNNPGLLVVVGGTSSFSKLLRIDESVDLDGHRLTFTGVKPWTELTAGYDPGANWVFGGIVIAIVGFSLFILFPSRRIKGYSDINSKQF